MSSDSFEKISRIEINFANTLKPMLKYKGMGQTDLAHKTGIGQGRISEYCRGKTTATLENTIKILKALGFNSTAEYHALADAIMEGKEPPEPIAEAPCTLTEDEMASRGFIAIPFSEEMKLAAGSGGTIPITDDEDCSPVIVHGPSLGLRNAKHLQAFRVGGDSMEPLIAQNGIVLADLSQSNIMNLHEGKVYVLCWDRDEGECAVKRLRWADKGKTVIIESEERFYPPVVKPVKEILLIGRVIWAWREL